MSFRISILKGIALGLLAVMVFALPACCCLKGERDQRPRVYRGGQYYGDAVHQ